VRLREDNISNLKCDLQRHQNTFVPATNTSKAAVEASFYCRL